MSDGTVTEMFNNGYPMSLTIGDFQMKHPGWFSVGLSLALMFAMVGFLYLIRVQ